MRSLKTRVKFLTQKESSLARMWRRYCNKLPDLLLSIIRHVFRQLLNKPIWSLLISVLAFIRRIAIVLHAISFVYSGIGLQSSSSLQSESGSPPAASAVKHVDSYYILCTRSRLQIWSQVTERVGSAAGIAVMLPRGDWVNVVVIGAVHEVTTVIDRHRYPMRSWGRWSDHHNDSFQHIFFKSCTRRISVQESLTHMCAWCSTPCLLGAHIAQLRCVVGEAVVKAQH